MKLTRKQVPIESLRSELSLWLDKEGGRIGSLTSIDGSQLAVLVMDTATGEGELWESALHDNAYTSLTLSIPQLHWFERVLWEMFGIVPEKHPRLKPVLLHGQYAADYYPLREKPPEVGDKQVLDREFHFLTVHGEGVWELPVGPIHAGVIEPGHFRFSCLGESILNLEISLGYVHRGVEKRIKEVPWRKARFVAEAAATDTAVANALAHSIAIENLFDVEVPEPAQVLRTIALEIERTAMHIIDIGGMATDIGVLGVSASMGRMRGRALGLGQMLTGSRFLRGYVLPGGVTRAPSEQQLKTLESSVQELRHALKPIINIFQDSQAVSDRFDGIGKVSSSLASEFGMVGVAARASGVAYDTRQHFRQGVYPKFAPPVALESNGDILSRTKVRIEELWRSLDVIEQLACRVAAGAVKVELPDKLPANQVAAGVVEAFRGELIHLVVTDDEGLVKRYEIKDPSFNNWTALSICVRNNLIADFPLCNKSLSLSYGGNDL